MVSLDSGIDLNDVYIGKGSLSTRSKGINSSSDSDVAKLIRTKSVLTTDFEKKDNVQPYEKGLRQQRRQRRVEREKTKGANWFGLTATEMTEEKKNDLTVLQMRRSLDPKRFYKAPDMQALPKYFEMGKVVESAEDFYTGRIPRKQRKQTLVDELLADAEFRKYNKRKYLEVCDTKKKGLGPYRHMKRLKKKK